MNSLKITIVIYFAFVNISFAQQNFFFTLDEAGNRIRQESECALQERLIDDNLFSRLELYPNPTNGFSYISFEVERKGHVEINLISLNNTLITTIQNSVLTPGSYQYSIDLKDLPSGLYFLRMKHFGITLNKKLVVMQ